ncbi:DDE-type integrase/transposase/recombinase [Fonticella tunisiensis]|uniref:Integrase-like protein n=1 Tax=Fonticella tunisiensis TaxID=1096341 RepID=A0A4R7K433_9CLOT|nr:integrase-like protein [Fonticella tunisiensis]
MVLSHSRYKLAYWQDKPFTATDFIYAHNKAFEYFGGMTTEIVYDQDRLLAVDENFGDIVFTEEFQKYIDLMKFKVYLCRGFDPQSKGKVEAVVKYIKYNFAVHRTFSDIASFNSECLAWLDRTGNSKVHGTTKKIPKEVFALEKKHLLSIPHTFDNKSSNISLTYIVRKDNTVLYKQNRYQVPKGTYCPGKKVELTIVDNIIHIKDIDSN